MTAPALPPAAIAPPAPPPVSAPRLAPPAPRPITQSKRTRPRAVEAKAAPTGAKPSTTVTLATPVVVFGTGPRGGLCAGRFRACDAAFALAAGRDNGLRVLRAEPEHAALIKPIKSGHLLGDGKAVLPRAKEAVIAALSRAADGAGEPAPGEVTASKAGADPAKDRGKPMGAVAAAGGGEEARGDARPPASAPAGGDGMRVGALVLALDEEEGGGAWYAAELARWLPEGRVQLRWQDYPDLPPVIRHRDCLALLPKPYADAGD